MEYIIVNTRFGYLMEHNGSISFTHDIADATVSTNFERMLDLCKIHVDSKIWVRDNPKDKWRMNKSQPFYSFEIQPIEQILREAFRYGTD